MTAITLVKSTLTTVISRISIIVASLQADFKSQTGSEATISQITSGSTSTEITTTEASSSILVSLQSLTVNEKTITDVKTLLTTLSSSGSIATEGGEEITGAMFLLRLEEFFILIENDITSAAITTFSLSITKITVTLTETEITSLVVFQETIETVLTKITLAITFYKSEFKTLTSSEATEDQITFGDATKTQAEVTEENEAKLVALSENNDRVAETSMLCGAIADDPIGATASGTVDVTTEYLCGLVDELLVLISANYLSTDTRVTTLMTEIQTARLTTELTFEQYVMVIQSVTRLDILVIEIRVTIQVISIQYLVITGVEASTVIEISTGGEGGGNDGADENQGEGYGGQDEGEGGQGDGEGTGGGEGTGAEEGTGGGEGTGYGEGSDFQF